MNNAIYYPGGVRTFNGDVNVRVWQLARRLSKLYGHCHVVTSDKCVQYSAGERVKRKLDIKHIGENFELIDMGKLQRELNDGNSYFVFDNKEGLIAGPIGKDGALIRTFHNHELFYVNARTLQDMELLNSGKIPADLYRVYHEAAKKP